MNEQTGVKKYRCEYPRPDFMREQWISLNGEWGFDYDDNNVGEIEQWYQLHEYKKKIQVPFCYQSELSGIKDTGYHPYIWYHLSFKLSNLSPNQSILLKFGAVDYYSKVWINGSYVGEHRGGYTPFEFDIAPYVSSEENSITLRVEDTNDCFNPRGKQYWEVVPERCWYIPCSGIWQSVWIEITGKTYFKSVRILPDIDHKCLSVRSELSDNTEKVINCKVIFNGKTVATNTCETTESIVDFIVPVAEQDYIEEFHLWSPERPNLYDVELTVGNGKKIYDKILSYIGMRKISVHNGNILLNNKPFYQKLIMDQGYWADGIMTAPSDSSYIDDLHMVKAMGFNGVRKHQKIEDPRFYYWADKIGVLVWEEMPSAYVFCEREIENVVHEWLEVLKRDINHPSVITWVTLNESWGVRNIVSSKQQQDFATTLYYMTKSIDPTRLVSSNDGWEQISASDLCSIHDYQTKASDIPAKYSDIDKLIKGAVQGRLLYAYGHGRKEQPVLLSEFGGIATENDSENSWGYNNIKVTPEELIKEYSMLIKSIKKLGYLSGYCYTQLTDVMQEVNGLLDVNHKPKIDPGEIYEINDDI